MPETMTEGVPANAANHARLLRGRLLDAALELPPVPELPWDMIVGAYTDALAAIKDARSLAQSHEGRALGVRPRMAIAIILERGA